MWICCESPQVVSFGSCGSAVNRDIRSAIEFLLAVCSTGVGTAAHVLVPQLNNFTFTFPSSPLLTQADDVDPDLLCRKETPPLRCLGLPICECVHVIDLPLGATVELILVDQGNGSGPGTG
jgi:hypothetical protein